MAGGAALGLAGSLMKKGAKIPAYQKVDQTQEQQDAIAANIASFDQAKALADQTTAADQDRLDAMLARTIPNYKQLISGSSNAIQNMIAGNLPMADQNVIMRKAAERGGGLGLAGSAAGRNLTARDLGLSSFQMTQAGLNNFNTFSSNMRQNFMVNPMSTSSMYVSPSQRISNAIQENQFAYQAAVGKAQSDAANSLGSRLGGFASSVGGMMMGAGMQGMALKSALGSAGGVTENLGNVGPANSGNVGWLTRQFNAVRGIFGATGAQDQPTYTGMPMWAME